MKIFDSIAVCIIIMAGVLASCSNSTTTGQSISRDYIVSLEMGNEVSDPAAADWRLDQAVAVGAGWVHVYVPWALVEQQQGVLTWKGTTPSYLPPMNFDLDYVMAGIRRRGLRAIAIIQYTPDWARSGGDFYTPPNDPRTYANFVKDVVKRYGDVARIVEIWNEVNLDDNFVAPPGTPQPVPFWHGTVAQYVAILNAAYDAVKTADPSIIVCSSGLSPLNPSLIGSWLDLFFGNEPKPKLDWFGWNPYGQVPGAGPDANDGTTASFRGFDEIAKRLDAEGYTNAPILLSEFGYRYDDSSMPDPEELVANMLPEAYAVAFSSARIKGLNWCSVKYNAIGGDFGLYTDSGQQRVSFKAFQTFIAVTAGYQFDVRERGTDNGTEPQVYRFYKDRKRLWMVYAPYVMPGYAVIEPQTVMIQASPGETLIIVDRDGQQGRLTADASGVVTVSASRRPLYLIEQ